MKPPEANGRIQIESLSALTHERANTAPQIPPADVSSCDMIACRVSNPERIRIA